MRMLQRREHLCPHGMRPETSPSRSAGIASSVMVAVFLILESIITTACEWKDSRPAGWVAPATAAVLRWPFRIRRKVIPSDNVNTKHAEHLTNLCIEQIDADLKVTLEEIPDNDFRMTLRNQSISLHLTVGAC